MEFAIVRFTSEDDAPGIISTRWLDISNNFCWFPNVRTEEMKKKLLIAHAAPKEDEWLKCPVRILRKFFFSIKPSNFLSANYHSARGHLRKAEDTSNLESEAECMGPRRKKRKVLCYPGEESSSDDETQNLYPFNSYNNLYPLPPPPAAKSNPRLTKTLSSPSPPPPPPAAITSSLNLYHAMSPTSSNSASLLSNLQELPSITNILPSPIPPAPAAASSLSSYTEGLNKIDILKNQKIMWKLMEELLESNKRIEQKLDLLISNCYQPAPSNSPVDEESEDNNNLIASLPLGVDDFIKLDGKICNSNFKNRLMNICKTIYGRDPKILVSNIMRRLMLDEVGEKFSLTGKSTKVGVPKISFERSETYKLILEICYQNFPEVKINVLREAMSDWLMQAKFRKSRKEKRAASKENAPNGNTGLS